MKKHQTRQPNLLVVAFDDEQTSLDAITKALNKGTFPVQGQPVYLKTFPVDDQSN